MYIYIYGGIGFLIYNYTPIDSLKDPMYPMHGMVHVWAAAGQPPSQLSSQAAGPGGLLMYRGPGPSCLTAELAWRLPGGGTSIYYATM